jgi:hypothetical protein
MYEKYGYFKEGLHTITLKGMDGAKQIQKMMDKARKNPPVSLAGLRVEALRDYTKDERKDVKTGETVIEDVKSEATRKDKTYQLKRKMMAYKGLYIEEVE